MRHGFLIIACFFSANAFSQADHSHRLERSLKFPDIPGYKSVKCDLHQHTVFSDGQVWPNIRVMESLMDGLDAISLTEHLEYQPHKDDIPHPDRNRSYEIAVKEAKDHDLIIIRGSEITRKMPPGHNNAIFIQDANKLLISDSVDVFREAKKQNAFTFWNHPSWISQRKDGVATLTDMHRMLIREKLIDGIEVVNDDTYSDEALQIALDNNLTIMGTSDIHGLIDWAHHVPYGHRPITIVFAKQKNAESIHEGLSERRTVVFHHNILIGREEFLKPLVEACLRIDTAYYDAKTDVLHAEIENNSSCEFTLLNKSAYTFHEDADLIVIRAREKKKITVKTIKRLNNIELKFEAINAVTAPARHPVITLKTKI